MTPIRHAYVHVPFCPTICPYCDFHVLTRQRGMVEAFLVRLEEETRTRAQAFATQLRTVYVGGGTPSFLRDHEITRLVAIVQKHLGWATPRDAGGEATLEVNPGTVTVARAQLWKDLGFDRVSVGVQSFDDKTLGFLGRTHNAHQAMQALDILHNTGFRVSADLITAVPNQNIRADLETATRLGLQHVSAYTLTIEDHTPFAKRGVSVNEDDETLALTLAEPILQNAGLQRYEISNHATPGQESRHNQAYWRNDHWYGLGPSATGHYPSAPHSSRNKNAPLTQWLQHDPGQTETPSAHEAFTDALFAGLRTIWGLDLRVLQQRTGIDPRQHHPETLSTHIQRGWLTLEDEHLRATREGWWVLNKIVEAYL